MTQPHGWLVKVPANVTDGTKATLGYVVRIADEAEARQVVSQGLGGIKNFNLEPLSLEEVESYGLKEGELKKIQANLRPHRHE